MGEAAGDPLPVSPLMLRKRLHEGGYLASTDASRETLTVRRTLQGAQRDVLHFTVDGLTRLETPDKPDISASTPPFEVQDDTDMSPVGATRSGLSQHSDITPDTGIPRRDATISANVGSVGSSRNAETAIVDEATVSAAQMSGGMSDVGCAPDDEPDGEAVGDPNGLMEWIA